MFRSCARDRVIQPVCFAALVAVVAVVAPALRPVGAQRVVERAESISDTAQHFAVYFPAAYPGTKLWPVLYVLDPRGRAMLALDRFRPAAERYGYVLMSSYNSLSDGDVQPNIDAMNAMLGETQRAISADFDRLYIAGFSGTARVGWAMGHDMGSRFAGILAAGAAPLLDDDTSRAILRSPGFGFAMTAGTMDFNFTEVRQSDLRLRERKVPALVTYFTGPHGWPPADLVDRSLAWFDLRAMLGGRRVVDSAWVRDRLAGDLTRATDLESHGQWLTAANELATIALGYASWDAAAAAAARARADSLDRRDAVKALRRAYADHDARFARENASILRELTRVRGDRDAHDTDALARALHLAELKTLATTGDSLDRPWAARVLASAQAFLGFYEPRAYLEQRQPVRALLMLETFRRIVPWSPQQCAFIAQAVAMLPDSARAIATHCE